MKSLKILSNKMESFSKIASVSKFMLEVAWHQTAIFREKLEVLERKLNLLFFLGKKIKNLEKKLINFQKEKNIDPMMIQTLIARKNFAYSYTSHIKDLANKSEFANTLNVLVYDCRSSQVVNYNLFNSECWSINRENHYESFISEFEEDFFIDLLVQSFFSYVHTVRDHSENLMRAQIMDGAMQNAQKMKEHCALQLSSLKQELITNEICLFSNLN